MQNSGNLRQLTSVFNWPIPSSSCSRWFLTPAPDWLYLGPGCSLSTPRCSAQTFMNIQEWKDQGWQREQSLKKKLKRRLHACLDYHWDSGNILLILKFLDEFGVGCVIIGFLLPLIIGKGSIFNNCLVDFCEGWQRNFEEEIAVKIENFGEK